MIQRAFYSDRCSTLTPRLDAKQVEYVPQRGTPSDGPQQAHNKQPLHMLSCQCLQEAPEWEAPPVAALVIPPGYQPAAGAEGAAAAATAQFRVILGHSHIGQDGVSGRLQQTMLQDDDDNAAVQDAETQLAFAVSPYQCSPYLLTVLYA